MNDHRISAKKGVQSAVDAMLGIAAGIIAAKSGARLGFAVAPEDIASILALGGIAGSYISAHARSWAKHRGTK